MAFYFDVGSYFVNVETDTGLLRDAVISHATQSDMPGNWSFSWREFWRDADPNFENFFKLTYQDELFGLIRYAIYPDFGNQVEVLHLESNPTSRENYVVRPLKPIGQWLIWYATQVALEFSEDNETPIFLTCELDYYEYYRDKIEMTFVQYTSIAPGEDGYVFKFTREQATEFCARLARQYGEPALIYRGSNQSRR